MPVWDVLLQGWAFHPLPLLLAALVGALYGRGLAALWARAGRGRGVPAWRALCFAAGLVVLVAALSLPLGALFSTHMAQHALLSLAAAPLLVLGAPQIALIWALPRAWRSRIPALPRLPRAGRPALLAEACLLAAATLWLWHLPGLYEAALHGPGLHAAAHGSFLGTAALFWWAVGLGGGPVSGASVVALFAMGLQNSALSALILAAREPWFGDHARAALLCDLAPLDDQRLAGLIMMLPCDAVYLGAALGLGAIWLRDLERRAQLAEGGPTAVAPAARPEGAR